MATEDRLNLKITKINKVMAGGSEGYMLLNSNYGVCVCYKIKSNNVFKFIEFIFFKKIQKSNMKKAVELVSCSLELL